MSKGGSPMGSGGFGGQQQQRGFGGGFGGQRFNQMPQQQQGGFGGIFGGGFGGQQPVLGQPGGNLIGGGQQQGGFGGGFGMPQQQRQYPALSSINSTPDLSLTARPQGFGSNLGNFLGRQGFNMPQRHGGDMPMISSGGFDPASGKFSPPKDQYGNPVTKPMRDPMRPMTYPMAPQQQPALGQPGGNLAVQDAALRSMGMPTSNEIDYTDPRRGQFINIAQPPRQQPQTQTNQPPATLEQLGDMLRGMGGGSQPGPRMQEYVPPEDQRPPNPYTQQVRQEDPRMQAMRSLQQMGGRF